MLPPLRWHEAGGRRASDCRGNRRCKRATLGPLGRPESAPSNQGVLRWRDVWGAGTKIAAALIEAADELTGLAAQRLGCDVQTMQRSVRTEQCPVVRDGRLGADPGGVGGAATGVPPAVVPPRPTRPVTQRWRAQVPTRILEMPCRSSLSANTTIGCGRIPMPCDVSHGVLLSGLPQLPNRVRQ